VFYSLRGLTTLLSDRSEHLEPDDLSDVSFLLEFVIDRLEHAYIRLVDPEPPRARQRSRPAPAAEEEDDQ